MPHKEAQFHGDNCPSENPHNIVKKLAFEFTRIPGITEPQKCESFYLRCEAGGEAERWYENSLIPTGKLTWATFLTEFEKKWPRRAPVELTTDQKAGLLQAHKLVEEEMLELKEVAGVRNYGYTHSQWRFRTQQDC